MTINEELSVEYADSGKWRSYSLYTRGVTLDELVQNASISETDQDGGEIRTYSLEVAPNDVDTEAMQIIRETYVRSLLAGYRARDVRSR